MHVDAPSDDIESVLIGSDECTDSVDHDSGDDSTDDGDARDGSGVGVDAPSSMYKTS